MQGKYTLTVEATMDCAHSLPDMHEGHACRRLHGHHYKVALEVTGEPGEHGYIVDYYALEAELKMHLGRLDHRFLNEELNFATTTERLCEYFASKILLPPNAVLAAVVIDETPGFRCRFEPLRAQNRPQRSKEKADER